LDNNINIIMTYIPSRINDFNTNAASATRIAQATTLFDGKRLITDDSELFENVGTGSNSYSNAVTTLSVTAGQFVVRQAIRSNPYFSGKAQLVEVTFDNFQTQANVNKRVGYFSSSTTSPFTATLDGFFIENNNGVMTLQMWRAGTQTLSIDFTSMDNADALIGYNWQNFTVCAFDFLWLGGALLRFFVKTDNGFELIHTFNYAGSAQGVFILSPNQPIRYEIRSTTGTGSFSAVCSQVSTEGSTEESGLITSFFNPTGLLCNTVGVNFVLAAIRMKPGFENAITEILEVGVIGIASADTGILYLVKNPTISAALTYNDFNTTTQIAYATTQTITAGTGKIILAIPTSAGTFPSTSTTLKRNYLGRLSSKLATPTTPDEYVLVYRPLTNNQTNTGVITIKQY